MCPAWKWRWPFFEALKRQAVGSSARSAGLLPEISSASSAGSLSGDTSSLGTAERNTALAVSPSLSTARYTGRFAPSPTGPLHAGSLVAALASWLDARAHKGRWLIRIEDVDTPRCQPKSATTILAQLAACSLLPDEAPVYQSRRGALYQQALDRLAAAGLAYPCGCTRQDIARALAASGQAKQRHGELVYPGTCRDGLHGKPARAWRFLTASYAAGTPLTEGGQTPAATGVSFRAAEPDLDTEARGNSCRVNPQTTKSGCLSADEEILWQDRRLGRQAQNVSHEVGDFVLKRADGLWAYQLAVVVDDAAQGITDIVRGEDLADNTARQILLQRALNLPLPRYLHTPLVLGANGEKLSKQNGAQAFDTCDPLAALNQAAALLGLMPHAGPVAAALESWVNEWKSVAARAVPEAPPPS